MRHVFRLRAADSDDIAAIQRVGLEADRRFLDVAHPELADGSTIPTDVALRAIADDRLVVAESGAEIVGWAYTALVGGELCLGQISVLPSWGRRGVGSALLEHVVDHARGKGIAAIVLSTQDDVAWNRAWFEARGFVVVPRERWTPAMARMTADQEKDGVDWSRRVHMRRVLQLEE
ncbi:MAG TPA: GNAT family N-acetyltransferase [Polyangiaceae bacterium]